MKQELTLPAWLVDIDDGVGLNLFVQASAKKTEIVGVHDGHLKLKVSSPPVDGAANRAIITFLSKYFSVKKNAVLIRHGELSKRKKVHIIGISIEEVRAATSESLWV